VLSDEASSIAVTPTEGPHGENVLGTESDSELPGGVTSIDATLVQPTPSTGTSLATR
jgi:hypothetical protein